MFARREDALFQVKAWYIPNMICEQEAKPAVQMNHTPGSHQQARSCLEVQSVPLPTKLHRRDHYGHQEHWKEISHAPAPKNVHHRPVQFPIGVAESICESYGFGNKVQA